MMNGGMQELDGVSYRRRGAVGFESLLTDPSFAIQNTAVTNTMGADGYNWSQAHPIIVDSHEKLIALGQKSSGAGHSFVYCNNPTSATPAWHDNALAEIALTRGSVALDRTNDVLHVLWTAGAATDGIIYRRYTISRDGSNNITAITKDTNVNLQLDFQSDGTMTYEHPILIHMNDGGADGTYGKLLAIWSAWNSGVGCEVRSSMCVLGATADRGKTAGNWTAPVSSDATTIGNPPQVGYSTLFSNTAAVMYPSAMRKSANSNIGDVYLFNTDGALSAQWVWRRMRWNGVSNNWSTGLTTQTTISALKRAGSDVGYSLKQQLGSNPVEDTASDRVYFGFATWKDNTDGDTWSFVHINNADVISSLVDVYVSGGAHSYAPTGDLRFDATTHRLVASYIKTTSQAAYVKLYDGTTLKQNETLMFSTDPVDIPLIGDRIGTGVAPLLFRDTDAPYHGWYGTMIWSGGGRTTDPSTPSLPSDIAGLKVWFKADTLIGYVNGAAITNWTDSSAGIVATPIGAGIQYIASAINAKPGVRALGDTLSFSPINLGTAHTAFFVIKPESGFSDGVLFGGSANGRYMPYFDGTDIYYRAISTDGFATVAHGGLSVGTPYLLEVRRNGTSAEFYKNGVQIGTTQTLNANTALSIQYLLGINQGFVPFADLCETFVFDTALSVSDRQSMESYINTRYAIF